MKLKDNFNLSHVIGFFVGVVVTVIINWIVFKDPKRVTAPEVAALVAICTFSLALWSANQVKKWLNNKINETAYKQAEISMELLRAIIIDLFNVSSHLKRLMEANQNNGEYARILEKLKPTHENCIENINKLIVVIESLPSWNINLIHKEIFSQAVRLMRENNFPSIVTRSVAILSNDKMVKDRKIFFMEHSPTIIMTADTVLYRLEGLLKIPYYKKFEHILHHP